MFPIFSAKPDMRSMQPFISDVTNTSVTIQWTELQNITDYRFYQYAIEFKSKVTSYLFILRLDTTTKHSNSHRPRVTSVSGLQPGIFYAFRVVPFRYINIDRYGNSKSERGYASREVATLIGKKCFLLHQLKNKHRFAYLISIISII